MEHIKQSGDLLTYYPLPITSIYYDIILMFLLGVVFISVYILKLPFYWLRHPRFPASRIISLYLGLFLVFLSIHNFLTTPNKRIEINKPKQEIAIVEASIIKEKRQEYSFKDIKNITVQRGDKTAHDYYYNLIINLENMQQIQIGEYAENTDYYKNSQELTEDGKKLASYIRVPFIKH